MKFKALNPDYQRVIERVLEGQHFMKHVGIEMVNCLPGKITLKLNLAQLHMQQTNFVHGGVTSTLCDIAMGFAALSLVEKNKSMVTADLHISYHRPAYGEEIWVELSPKYPGSDLGILPTERVCLDATPPEALDPLNGYAAGLAPA